MAESNRKLWKVILTASLVVVLVLWTIHYFGAEKVQAFGSVMSFLAVVVAAYATVIYVHKTSEIAAATRTSAEQQARVAGLMEQDLHFRITPHLRYESLGASGFRCEGQVRNNGTGTAVEIKGEAILVGSGKTQSLHLLPPALEPRHDHVQRVWFDIEPTSTGYSILLSCTDSLYLKNYRFKYNESGLLLEFLVVPRT